MSTFVEKAAVLQNIIDDIDWSKHPAEFREKAKRLDQLTEFLLAEPESIAVGDWLGESTRLMNEIAYYLRSVTRRAK